MSSRRRRRTQSQSTNGKPHLSEMDLVAQLLENVLLIGIVAVPVSMILSPPESVVNGTGLLNVLLWLLLFAVWSGLSLIRGKFSVRMGTWDILFLSAVAWHSLSAIVLVMSKSGDSRHAINMGWEWVGYGVGYFLFRQLVYESRHILSILVVGIAMAVMLSGAGLYQYSYQLPKEQREYKSASEEVKLKKLKDAGMDNAPEGSRQRKLFENRLFSKEPIATFSLTNSLAAFIAPWLIVIVSVGWFSGRRNQNLPSLALIQIGIGICALIVASCLVLTKSRTAFLAVAIGAGFLIWFALAGRKKIGRHLTTVILIACVVLGVGGVAIGGLDAEVLSEAPKSLLYRIEYWKSTFSMISKYPLFGCGPGNYQTTFAQFQLPQTSETVAEPHNFLLEIAATAGVPAMILFGIFLWLSLVRMFRQLRLVGDELGDDDPDNDPVRVDELLTSHYRARVWLSMLGFLLGIFLGLIFAFLNQFAIDAGMLIVGFACALLASATILSLGLRGHVDRLSIAMWTIIAMGVFFVNLLATGGINFPAIMFSGMILLIVGLNTLDADDQVLKSEKAVFVFMLLCAAVLTISLQRSAISPILRVQPLLEQAENGMMQGDVGDVEALLERASLIDGYSSEVPRLQFIAALIKSTRSANPADFDVAIKAANHAIAFNPRSSLLRREMGSYFYSGYQSTGRRNYLESCQSLLQQSIDLKPNESIIHAEYASVCQSLGEIEKARAAADRAFELDKINQNRDHFERLLSGQALFGLPQDERKLDAEQIVQQIRSQP